MSDPSQTVRSAAVSLPLLLALSACGCSQTGSAPAQPSAGGVRPTGPRASNEGPQPAALAAQAPVERDRSGGGYREWDIQQAAAIALSRIGVAAAPELTRTLASPDPRVRQLAAEVLARIGPEARDSVPQLIQLARNEQEDERVRKAAIWALGQIGPPAAEAVPELMRILRQRAGDTAPR